MTQYIPKKTLPPNENAPIRERLVRMPRAAILMGLTVLALGGLALIAIPKESAPNIRFGVAVINTTLIGASAEDIDDQITSEIEDQISGMIEISSYTSTSRYSSSSIVVEFNTGVDVQQAILDLEDRVEDATLPSDIEEDPIVTEIDSNSEPLLSIILSGDVSQTKLLDYARDLQEEVEDVQNITEVVLSGGRDREIEVLLDIPRLESYGLTPAAVSSAIAQRHRDTPIGSLESAEQQYTLTARGKLLTAEDVAGITLTNVGSSTQPAILTVADVSISVQERPVEVSSIVRFRSAEGASEEYRDIVNLQVSKEAETDIFAIREGLREVLGAFLETNPGLTAEIVNDQVAIMEQDFDQVLNNGLMAVVIVGLAIFFFVGIREGLIASLIIPLSIACTIWAANTFGAIDAFPIRTLNFMTNFSMIMALGILVDTAIVIVEGARSFIRQGYGPQDAAILSIREFFTPLLTGFLTTVAVFIPMLTLPGVLGQYLGYIPSTVIIILVCSILIAFYLLPAYVAILMTAEHEDVPPEKPLREGGMLRRWWRGLRYIFGLIWYRLGRIGKWFRSVIDYVIDEVVVEYYAVLLRWLFRSVFLRGVFIIFVIGSFFASFLLPVETVNFPDDDSTTIFANIEYPATYTPEQVLQLSSAVGERIFEAPEVKLADLSISGGEARYRAELYNDAELLEREIEGRVAIDIEQIWQADMALLVPSEADLTVERLRGGPPEDFPVGFRVNVEDGSQLELGVEITRDITQLLSEVEGMTAVKNDITLSPGSFLYTVRDDQAQSLGLSRNDVYGVLSSYVTEREAATITRGKEDVDIMVRTTEESIQNPDDLLSLQIQTPTGALVTIGQLVDVVPQDSLEQITRNDGSLSFTVQGRLQPGANAIDITSTFLEQMESYEFPPGISLENAQDSDFDDVNNALLTGLPIAIFLIFVILVLQFNSYVQPLLIIFTIVFAQMGVNFGLWAFDSVRSLGSNIAVIALVGIVVNDSIIIVDQINKYRAKASRLFSAQKDAMTAAAKSRFIPVVLTTVTSSGGVLPLVFVDSFWMSFALTIAFGLFVASTLTLFLSPVLSFHFRYTSFYSFGFIGAMLVLGFGVFFGLLSDDPTDQHMIMVGASAFVGLVTWLLMWRRERKLRAIEDEHDPRLA